MKGEGATARGASATHACDVGFAIRIKGRAHVSRTRRSTNRVRIADRIRRTLASAARPPITACLFAGAARTARDGATRHEGRPGHPPPAFEEDRPRYPRSILPEPASLGRGSAQPEPLPARARARLAGRGTDHLARPAWPTPRGSCSPAAGRPGWARRRRRWSGTARRCCGARRGRRPRRSRPVVVVRAPGQQLPDLPAERRGRRRPARGPRAAAGHRGRARRGPADRAAVAFVCSTDLPFLHPALRRAASSTRSTTGRRRRAARVARGYPQPLAAAYRTGLGARGGRAGRRPTGCARRSSSSQCRRRASTTPPCWPTRRSRALDPDARLGAQRQRARPTTSGPRPAGARGHRRVLRRAGATPAPARARARVRAATVGAGRAPRSALTLDRHVVAALNGDQITPRRRAAADRRRHRRLPLGGRGRLTGVTACHGLAAGGYFGRALVVDVDRRHHRGARAARAGAARLPRRRRPRRLADAPSWRPPGSTRSAPTRRWRSCSRRWWARR